MARVALLLSILAALCAPAVPASAEVAPPHGDEIPPGADAILAGTTASMVTALADTTWCGTQTSADDVEHQAAAGNAIKVVYAHAADEPDRFAQYADVIQADVKAVADAFLSASSTVKTVRFDLGTACGPSYVDVQAVTLPHARASYFDASGLLVDALRDDLKPWMTSPECPNFTMSGACTPVFLV